MYVLAHPELLVATVVLVESHLLLVTVRSVWPAVSVVKLAYPLFHVALFAMIVEDMLPPEFQLALLYDTKVKRPKLYSKLLKYTFLV